MSGDRAFREGTPDTPERVVASFVAYVAVLGVCAVRWIRTATHAVPAGTLLVSPSNARLISWALGWVAHALLTMPSHLYDANVNYPAPAQLTGTEHLLSSQVIFAPVFLATGNALLGANVVALLSYPFAALAMERLLRALDLGRAAAWTGGLLFALGPLRVPGNLQLIQYQNTYLALETFLLTRLRQRPGGGTAVLLTAALAMGMLSSYYLAVMIGVLGVLWGAMEFGRPGLSRWRFLLFGGGAGAAALGLVAVISVPYFVRREASGVGALFDIGAAFRANPDVPGAGAIAAIVTQGMNDFRPETYQSSAFWARVAIGFFRVLVIGWFGAVPLVLAALGLLALASRAPSARRAASRGLVIFVLSFPLIFLPLQLAGRYPTHTALGTILMAPFRVFRLPYRFAVVAGFGTALLGAAALEAAASVLGPRAGRVVTAAAATAVLLSCGANLVGQGLDEVGAQTAPIYDAVRDTARAQGPGPLLELPVSDVGGALRERNAMLASIRHGLPLITGYTGYAAAHHDLLYDTIGHLPAPRALENLVDMTHLRWLLLQPVDQWPTPGVRAGLLALPDVTVAWDRDGWVLARVDRVPQHPEWFAAIASGAVPHQPPPPPTEP